MCFSNRFVGHQRQHVKNCPAQVSGKSVFGMMPALWNGLASAFDPQTDQLDVQAACDRVVALIYVEKFPKHIGQGGVRTLRDVLDRVRRAPKMSQRLKDSMPSQERIECTVRNANWLVQYWTREEYPDPVQQAYGFARNARGAPMYADDAPQQKN